MKNLIKTVLFVLVCYTTLILVKSSIYSSDNTDKVLYDFESRFNNIEHKDTDEEPLHNPDLNQSSETTKTKEVINIVGLGDVDYSTLEKTSNIVEQFYGIETNIVGYKDITQDLCLNQDTLNADNCVFNLNNDVKTIYVTNNNLYSSNGMRLRGYTTLYGKTIIIRGNPEFIRETTIHELGHTFGLDHCSDLTCVMAVNNDDQDSGDFCNECKSKLNK